MNYSLLSRFKGIKGFLSIILRDENTPLIRTNISYLDPEQTRK